MTWQALLQVLGAVIVAQLLLALLMLHFLWRAQRAERRARMHAAEAKRSADRELFRVRLYDKTFTARRRRSRR